MEYKQVIAVRQDLKLPKGKLAAQVAHAAVEACFRALKTDKKIVDNWRAQGMKKIVIKLENESMVHKLKSKAEQAGIACAIITDAGKTVVAPGTITCISIGPAEEKLVDEITSEYSLM